MAAGGRHSSSSRTTLPVPSQTASLCSKGPLDHLHSLLPHAQAQQSLEDKVWGSSSHPTQFSYIPASHQPVACVYFHLCAIMILASLGWLFQPFSILLKPLLNSFKAQPQYHFLCYGPSRIFLLSYVLLTISLQQHITTSYITQFSSQPLR